MQNRSSPPTFCLLILSIDKKRQPIENLKNLLYFHRTVKNVKQVFLEIIIEKQKILSDYRIKAKMSQAILNVNFRKRTREMIALDFHGFYRFFSRS